MFDEINGRFGFGCMRLPEKDGKVDYEEFSKMADKFIESGFNYFDTAFGYHNELSEVAVRECVVKRHKREDFLLADKLTTHYFSSEEEVIPLFNKQLEKCGVEYFDFYLLHAMCDEYHKKFKSLKVYEKLAKLKEEGKIKHIGMSFHDRAFVLDKILDDLPLIEFVQIQFNYWDFEDVAVESQRCYEYATNHNKPVFIMEPVKGGRLVNLPSQAKAVFDKHFKGGSTSEFALRFAANFENVRLVLSGMNNFSQLEQNVSLMKRLTPLSKSEFNGLLEIGGVLRGLDTISCTACRYCLEVCPKNIPIPYLIACLNHKKLNEGNPEEEYKESIKLGSRAIDCIKCGKCEGVCPQHLDIREHMKKTARVFDKSAETTVF